MYTNTITRGSSNTKQMKKALNVIAGTLGSTGLAGTFVYLFFLDYFLEFPWYIDVPVYTFFFGLIFAGVYIENCVSKIFKKNL